MKTTLEVIQKARGGSIMWDDWTDIQWLSINATKTEAKKITTRVKEWAKPLKYKIKDVYDSDAGVLWIKKLPPTLGAAKGRKGL